MDSTTKERGISPCRNMLSWECDRYIREGRLRRRRASRSLGPQEGGGGRGKLMVRQQAVRGSPSCRNCVQYSRRSSGRRQLPGCTGHAPRTRGGTCCPPAPPRSCLQADTMSQNIFLEKVSRQRAWGKDTNQTVDYDDKSLSEFSWFLP